MTVSSPQVPPHFNRLYLVTLTVLPRPPVPSVALKAKASMQLNEKTLSLGTNRPNSCSFNHSRASHVQKRCSGHVNLVEAHSRVAMGAMEELGLADLNRKACRTAMSTPMRTSLVWVRTKAQESPSRLPWTEHKLLVGGLGRMGEFALGSSPPQVQT